MKHTCHTFYAIAAACFLPAIIGCTSRNASTNQIEIDANGFPVTTTLEDKAIQLPGISSIGISEIKVLDSVLIVSVLENEDFWHFYSIPKMDSIGRFFNVGNGPYEFPAPIPCFQSSFHKAENGDFLAYIPLPDRHKICEANLSKLLLDNDLEANVRILDVDSEQMPVWTFGIDQSKYIQAFVNPEKRAIERAIRTYENQTDTDEENPYLEMLNSRSVTNMENFQLLLTTPSIGQNGNKIAEIPGYNNQIIIYDTSGNGGACVTYKNIPDNESEFERLSRHNLSLFGGGYGHDNYFAFIRNEIKDDKIANQYFDFISWNGKPLGSISSGMNTIRRFDIDRENGILFCLDGSTDEIKAFDIKSFLRDIDNI